MTPSRGLPSNPRDGVGTVCPAPADGAKLLGSSRTAALGSIEQL
ncbi:MAG: hypothetical protein AAGA83_01910 [Cyanobacteria bacterium P01_F01_bin.116]